MGGGQWLRLGGDGSNVHDEIITAAFPRGVLWSSASAHVRSNPPLSLLGADDAETDVVLTQAPDDFHRDCSQTDCGAKGCRAAAWPKPGLEHHIRNELFAPHYVSSNFKYSQRQPATVEDNFCAIIPSAQLLK